MDACYILLGRPWLYDRRVMHDAFLNTYTLHRDGRKITLAPLAPQQITKPKTKESPKDGEVYLSFLEPTLKADHHEYKPLKEIILFTPSQDDHTETPSHPLAIQLLTSFAHVFPDEIPSGLPPKRTIQHHIDLIFRAVFLTNPHIG